MISIELWRSRIGLVNNKNCFGFLSSSFLSSSCSYRKHTRNLSRKHSSSTVDAYRPLQAEIQSAATPLDGYTSSSSTAATTTTTTTSSSSSSSSSSSFRGVNLLHYHSLLRDVLIFLLIISQQLIILSGDIETNPGPRSVDQKPNLEDLLCTSYTGKDGETIKFRLMDQVKPHWRRLAIALKFPLHEIADMDSKDDPVYYLLSEWLRGANQEKDSRPVTWGTLIEALRDANVQNEANILEQHCVCSMATHPSIVMQHGPIKVELDAVPEGLCALMDEYADMLVSLMNTKLSDENFCHLKQFLSEYCDDQDFKDCLTLDKVIQLLKDKLKLYIFNIDTLATACCRYIDSSTVKESIQKYKRLLNAFLSNTPVKQLQCSLQSKITSLDHNHMELVTLKLKETSSMDTLEKLNILVYHFFGIFSKAFIHCETRPGCVCITWLVPTSLVPILKIKAEQLSHEYLASQGVLELVIGLRLVPNEKSSSSSISDAESAEVQAEKQHEKPETVSHPIKPNMITTDVDDEDLQAKIAIDKQMSRAQDKEMSALEKQMSVIEELESELKVKCEQQETELKVVHTEKSDYEATFEETELKAVQKENSYFKKKCGRLETELKAMQKEKSGYEKKCEQQENKLKAVRKEKSDYKDKCEQQENELKAVQKERSDYKDKCEQQETELKAARNEISNYEKKWKQQETELKAARKKKLNYEEKCKQQEELNAVQKEKLAYEDKPHSKTAEQKQAFCKEWHLQCFKCVQCGRFLDPGRLLEHDGKPYCSHCYKNLFGSDGFRAGSSQPQRALQQMGEPLSQQQKNEIMSRIKEYNMYKEVSSEQLKHRELNDRLFYEGILKIYWGLKKPITVAPRKNYSGRKSTFRDSSLNFVSIDDESFGAILENVTEKFIQTMGEMNNEEEEEEDYVTQSLNVASIACLNSVPTDLAGHMEHNFDPAALQGDEDPGDGGGGEGREDEGEAGGSDFQHRIKRGSRTRVVLQQKTDTQPRDSKIMVRRRSASFRKVLKYKRETEAKEEKRSKFIPPYGNPTHLRVSNIQKVPEVVDMLMQKYHVENDRSDFVLMVMHDNGATELLSVEDCPLQIRLKLGPSEDIAKLYIIDVQDAEKVGVSQEVAEYIKFQEPELRLFLRKYDEEEQREKAKIVKKFSIFRGAVQEQIDTSVGLNQMDSQYKILMEEIRRLL